MIERNIRKFIWVMLVSCGLSAAIFYVVTEPFVRGALVVAIIGIAAFLAFTVAVAWLIGEFNITENPNDQ